ncbi:MAG: sensor histidine kinase [Gemmatirosa sp.]
MRVSLLHSSARPLAGIAAAVVGAAALLRAARRRRTEATDPSHALLRGLFETSPDPSFVKDPAGRYLLCNAAAAQAMGHPVAAILGRTDAELLPAAQAAAVRAVDARVLATGEAITVEETVGEGDARRIYLSTKGVYRDADGGVVGVFGIARDITQRKADELALADANRVLEEARGRAEAASRAKSDFLATMSHELRTPLNAILGYADLLAMGLPGAVSDGQGRYFTRIEASGRHLLALIDDVLDVSKIEAGELTVDRRPSELVDVVEAALTLVRPQADAKRVALAAPAPEACAALRYVGDPDRVRQVLVNLLSNAVKFTPEGGRVDVTCGVEGDGAAPQIAVAVRDTGIGIPAEQHARIFEPFVQVNGGLSRRVGGTGLGLAISRQLVHLMGGEITVESAPGAGSTFTLWLPASSAAWEARVRLGERLLARMSDVLTAYVDALRHDPALPGAAQATRSALEGHAGALLAAMAHDFAVLDDGAADRGSLIADGGAFKALLAERHGGQRGRLGWDAALLGRDFAHLGDAIEHVLLGVPPRNRDAAALGDQLALLRAFLAEAESLAVEGLQRGVHTGTHAVPHAVPPAPAAPVV